MKVKAFVGLRPSFSAHVRWCEHGAPVWSGEAGVFGLLRHVWSGEAGMFGLLRHVWGGGAGMFGLLRRVWSGEAAMFGLLRHVRSCGAAMLGLLRHVRSCGAAMFGLLFFFLALTAASVHAQQIGQNTSSTNAGTYTLTAKSQLVVETVVVKDKEIGRAHV